MHGGLHPSPPLKCHEVVKLPFTRKVVQILKKKVDSTPMNHYRAKFQNRVSRVV